MSMWRRVMARFTVVVAAVVVMVGAVPGVAVAASGFTVSGGPVDAVILTPGAPATVTFSVHNDGSGPADFAVQLTGLHFEEDRPQFTGTPSPGLSVTADPSRLRLAAGEAHDVHVTLTANPGAVPGGLYAGVVFTHVASGQPGRTVIQEAQARPLIGHVPGPANDDGRIIDFRPPPDRQAGSVTFTLRFRDIGTIDYHLGGVMNLTTGGHPLATITVPASLVLPGNTRAVPLTYTGTLPPGRLKAELQLVWGVTGQHHGSITAETTLNPNANPHNRQPTSGTPPFNTTHTISRDHTPSGLDYALDTLALLLIIILLILAYKHLRNQQANTRRHLQQQLHETR